MGDLFGRQAIEMALLSGMNIPANSKFTDGTYPHNFWVTKGGADGLGNGSFDNPYLTVRRAIRECRDDRGDRILTGPGSYAETLDIGAGGTGYGSGGGYAKRGLQILGAGGFYNGRVQIIGDGATAQPTIRVQGEHIGGFVLKNLELDTNGLAQAALQLTSDDTGASPAASDGSYRFLVENVAIRSDDPDVGILLAGATLGELRKCWIQGPQIGLAITGSSNNNPSDLFLEDFDFKDCLTADIATVGGTDSTGARTTIVGRGMANLSFHRMRHWDRATTPVVNYVNFPPGFTHTDVHFFDCYAARDVADDTLLVIQTGTVWIGKSAAGAEFIIGS